MRRLIDNFWLKVLGDRRDQRIALRAAGFADEVDATRWALSLDEAAPGSELALVHRIRRARPDLTGATAVYIARQTRVRHG